MPRHTSHVFGPCLIVFSLLMLPSANAGDNELTESESCINKKIRENPSLTRKQASIFCAVDQSKRGFPTTPTTPCPAGAAGSCTPGVGRSTDGFTDPQLRLDVQRPSLDLRELHGIDTRSTQ